jgi:hypothetical protein
MSRADALTVACPICWAPVGELCRDSDSRQPLPPLRFWADDTHPPPTTHYARMLCAESEKKEKP